MTQVYYIHIFMTYTCNDGIYNDVSHDIGNNVSNDIGNDVSNDIGNNVSNDILHYIWQWRISWPINTAYTMTYLEYVYQWHITWHIRFIPINPGKSYTVHHDIYLVSPWHITWWLSWHIYMTPLHYVCHDIYSTSFSMPVNPTQFSMTYTECQHDIWPC